jgi:hypothetical protein
MGRSSLGELRKCRQTVFKSRHVADVQGRGQDRGTKSPDRFGEPNAEGVEGLQ